MSLPPSRFTPPPPDARTWRRGTPTLGPETLGDRLRSRITRELGPDAMLYSPTQTLREGARLEESTRRPAPTLDAEDLTVLRRIGRGGSGVVEAARQSSLGRDVALKRVHYPEDQRSVDTLLREAAVTARLNHPSIVPVHRLFEDPDLGPVIVMGLLDGRTWRHGTDAHTPEGRRACIQVAIEVCFALEYAHSQSVLHLDVKPDNILLGSFGEVHLIDWGIAMDLLVEPIRTVLKGTPTYMAPEMLTPETTPLTVRTDVYLLAGSLLEVLTGRPPHTATSLLEAMVAAAEPVHIPASLPPSLAAVLRRALSVDPAARHASVADLRADLEDHLAQRDAERLLLQTQLAWDDAADHPPGTCDYRQLLARLDAADDLRPGRPDVAAFRATLARAWLAEALALDDLASARLAADRLAPEDPRCAALLDELDARQNALQRAGAHLQHMERALDLAAHSRQRRNAFGALLAVLLVVQATLTLLDPRPTPPPPEQMLALAVGCSLVWAGIVVAFRATLRATYGSREAVHTMSLAAVGIVLHRAWAVHAGTDPVAIGQVDLLLYTLILASRANLHRVFRWATVWTAACFGLATWWPLGTRLLLTVGPVGVLTMLVFLWDRVSEDRPTV
jgi:hypothetical protein